MINGQDKQSAIDLPEPGQQRSGLAPIWTAPPVLSGGEKQKIALACIDHIPKLLFLVTHTSLMGATVRWI